MKVGCCIICHRLERFVDQAVNTVLQQTRPVDELVVVGTDARQETRQVLQKWKDKANVQISGNKMKPGSSKNWAVSFLPVDCDALFVLDADDWLSPEYVKECLPFIESGENDLVGSDYIMYQENRTMAADLEHVSKMAGANPLPSCALMTRKAFFDAGTFGPELYDDWALWIRIWAKGYGIRRVAKPLVCHRVRRESYGQNVNTQRALDEITNLIRELKSGGT